MLFMTAFLINHNRICDNSFKRSYCNVLPASYRQDNVNQKRELLIEFDYAIWKVLTHQVKYILRLTEAAQFVIVIK